jgi:protoheme IX farnesyltransferase
VTIRSLALDVRPARAAAALSGYLELTKPRIVMLILVTTAVGFFMGSDRSPDLLLLANALAGTGLTAAGALALNQYLEREADGRMERTKRRPLPEGRVQPIEALAFGALLATAGLVYLTATVNALAAAVTAVTVISYLFAYTPMKRLSAFCTVVGAVPGALPPVTGWAAATGHLGVGAAILFGIMFFWQLPHSLAIAWIYRDDYARAGTRLLPTVEPGGRSTARQIAVNALALMAVGLLPTLVGMAGWIYFVVVLAMGGFLLRDALRAAVALEGPAARRLLHTTFFYVPIVLVTMAIDRLPFVARG